MEAGHPERDAGKNKRGIRPRAFLVYWSFYGLSKDQRRRIFAGWSLHGFFTVFTKTASRYESTPKAGWASRRPSSGTHKDRHPFSARAWVFFGLCEDRFPM